MKRIHIATGFVVLTLCGCKDFSWKSRDQEKLWNESEKAPVTTVPWKGQAVATDTFIKIAQTADLGVVNIGTTQIIKQKRRSPFFLGPQGRSPFEDFFGRDFFRDFFGDRFTEDAPEVRRSSLGSGFVVNEEGYIVTNNHVVERADEITVTIGKDREYKAKLVGSDPKTDVALIRIQPKEKLKPLSLGDSDQLEVGEIVVAIGNPFGLSHTVTQGIVSAKERAIGFGPYDNFIQTDASINPGNSGGPLLNLRAEVVGINAAIVATGQGIGFAIPINLAKTIIPQLKTKGSVTRAWLGVLIQKVDPELAKSLKLKDRRGALVSSVQKGSPAEKAGIVVGDVIVKVDKKEIQDFNELPRYIAGLPVDKTVTIELLRDGKRTVVTALLGELKPGEKEEDTSETRENTQESTKPDVMGISVTSLTDELARKLGMEKGAEGVVVENVKSGPAAEKGIQPGDIIMEINRQKVSNVEAYRKISKSLKKGETVMLLVPRGAESTIFVAFTL